MERGSRNGDRTDDDLVDMVGQLRSIIARQQRTIAEQRDELETLRRRAGPAPTKTPPARTAAASGGSMATANGTDAGAVVATAAAGADFTIVFDGGARGNPGQGYGSYQIVSASGLLSHERLEYGDRVTNNQAEYRTLIEALTDLRDRLGRAAAETTVAVRGDSQLVVQQVNGRWKVKHPELQPLHEQARELLKGFRKTDVAWHRRDASVRVLGH